MKRLFIITLVVVSMFINIAYASSDINIENNEGIMPDSILYTFDKLFEDIQLAVVFDSEKEAELIMEFAKERLFEAKLMSDEEKSEFVKKAIEDYLVKLEEAQQKITEAIVEDEISEESKEKLSEELEKITNEIDENIEQALDENVKEEFKQKVDNAYLVARVVRGLDKEKVIELRQSDLGYGQIAKIFMLAENSDKTVDEIAQMIKEDGKGFGEITKELGIHPRDLKSKGLEGKQKGPKKAIKELKYIDGENEEVKTEESEVEVIKNKDNEQKNKGKKDLKQSTENKEKSGKGQNNKGNKKAKF